MPACALSLYNNTYACKGRILRSASPTASLVELQLPSCASKPWPKVETSTTRLWTSWRKISRAPCAVATTRWPSCSPSALQSLLLYGVYRVAGEVLARATLFVPGLSQGRNSSVGRRRAAAERVLRGEDERRVQQNGEGGGGLRGLFQKRESRCVLPPVHGVPLCALHGAASRAACIRRAQGGKP